MATILDGKKRIPFMRGMLVHHLIQHGFDHEEAYELADEVRTRLRDRKSVARDEVLALLGELLARHHGDRPVADLVFWERAPTSITVERKSGSRPFSKERLTHSVQASGLAPAASMEVAQRVEDRLVEKRLGRVRHSELERLVEEILAAEHGDSFALHYRVWRVWAELDRPLVILIGGASGVGKTTLAIALASLIDIPRVVATDDIRQILRLTLAPDLMPAIHRSSYAAGEAASDSLQVGLDPAIAGYREQARVVGVGVRAILSRCVEENASVIIDGVHLLPGFFDLSDFAQSAIIVPITLAITDRDDYEQRFAKRKASAPARGDRKYLDNLEQILEIQDHILQCSEEESVPCIDVSAVDDPSSAAVTAIAERLLGEKDIRQRLDGRTKARK